MEYDTSDNYHFPFDTYEVSSSLIVIRDLMLIDLQKVNYATLCLNTFNRQLGRFIIPNTRPYLFHDHECIPSQVIIWLHINH